MRMAEGHHIGALFHRKEDDAEALTQRVHQKTTDMARGSDQNAAKTFRTSKRKHFLQEIKI